LAECGQFHEASAGICSWYDAEMHVILVSRFGICPVQECLQDCNAIGKNACKVLFGYDQSSAATVMSFRHGHISGCSLRVQFWGTFW
jgi:hypothetical protein